MGSQFSLCITIIWKACENIVWQTSPSVGVSDSVGLGWSLSSSHMMRCCLVRGPHFDNHCSRPRGLFGCHMLCEQKEGNNSAPLLPLLGSECTQALGPKKPVLGSCSLMLLLALLDLDLQKLGDLTLDDLTGFGTGGERTVDRASEMGELGFV